MQNKRVQPGRVALTSVPCVPRLHTVLFFNPLREGGLTARSRFGETEERGRFSSESHIKKESYSCWHTARPSVPPPLKKLPLLLLPPAWHQNGRATFLPVEPAQPTPLPTSPPVDPKSRGSCPREQVLPATRSSQLPGGALPLGSPEVRVGLSTWGIWPAPKWRWGHPSPAQRVSLHQDTFFSVAEVISLV